MGNTGRKVQIGKYLSDNTNREIHIMKLQITNRFAKYKTKVEIGYYKSEEHTTGYTNRKHTLEHTNLENTNRKIMFEKIQTR